MKKIYLIVLLIIVFQTNAKTCFGSTKDNNNNQISDMVKIPAGSFNMGDQTGGTIDRTAIPVHSVYVSEFYMDKYETYWSLWEEVTTWGISHGYSFDSGKKDNKNTLEKPDRHPVMYLSWVDAVKYCNARSEMMGFTPCYYTSSEKTNVYRTGTLDIKDNWVNWSANGFRLPTEAEWEKAARGGLDKNFYPWPSIVYTDIKGSDCNYKGSGDPWDQGANNPKEDVPFCTSPVGYYAANGYGLYDMAGNAAEWVWDYGDANWYSNAGAIVADNHGPATGNNGANRVFRGCSVDDSPYSMTCALRGDKWLAALAIDAVHIDFGVRTVRVNTMKNSRTNNP